MFDPNIVACLGPEGTHSQAAAKYLFPCSSLVLYPSISAAMSAINKNEASFCIVPIENSIEGSVNITLDTLSANGNFCIVKELVWPIRHHLMLKNRDIPFKKIISHPQALAQCRKTLIKLYPDAILQDALSTALGAEIAAKSSEYAAIGSFEAAAINNLEIVAHDIQDSQINCTRFVVIKPSSFQAAEESAAKTSLACELEGSKPGVLYELLKEFAERKINLVRIESRPARTALGRYIFFLDFEGSSSDPFIKDALEKVSENTTWLKILGSYPVINLQKTP